MRARRPAISPACTPRRPRAPTSRTPSRSIRSPPRTSAPRRGFPRSSSDAMNRARSGTATPATAAPTPTASRGAARRRRCRPRPIPRLAFERLFGGLDAGLDPETRARRRRQRRSILDLVADRTNSLVSTLGPSDRRKMDEYLTSVREIERRIQVAEQDTREVTPDFEMPSGVPVTFAEYATLMYDIQAVAFQADLTRVATLMIGREGSLRTYPEIGVPDPHHPLTHHQNNPEWIEKITKVNTFHLELFAKIRRQAARDAGRRRHGARSLDHRVWQRHLRRQRAHPRGSAGAPRRRRRRDSRQPARRLRHATRR